VPVRITNSRTEADSGDRPDEASKPRYIETLPRRGYRFMVLLNEKRPITQTSELEYPKEPAIDLVGGEEPPKKADLPSPVNADRLWGASGKEWPELRRFAKALSRMDNRQRRLLLAMAQRMAGRNRV